MKKKKKKKKTNREREQEQFKLCVCVIMKVCINRSSLEWYRRRRKKKNIVNRMHTSIACLFVRSNLNKMTMKFFINWSDQSRLPSNQNWTRCARKKTLSNTINPLSSINYRSGSLRLMNLEQVVAIFISLKILLFMVFFFFFFFGQCRRIDWTCIDTLFFFLSIELANYR